MTDMVCIMRYGDNSMLSSLRTIATKTYPATAIQICGFTAFSEVPKKRWISRCCFHPTKKQLDLPPLPVQGAHRDGIQIAAVGQEDQPLAGVGIPVADAAQVQGIALLRPLAVEGNQLVRLDAVLAVLGVGVDPVPGQVLLRPRDEAGSRLMPSEQPLEIDIGPVHCCIPPLVSR